MATVVERREWKFNAAFLVGLASNFSFLPHTNPDSAAVYSKCGVFIVVLAGDQNSGSTLSRSMQV